MLQLRPMTLEEHATITHLRQSRTEAARLVERARTIWLASQGWRVPAIAVELRLTERTVRLWLKRFNAAGLDGLRDAPRSGCPPTYSREQVGDVIATARAGELASACYRRWHRFTGWTIKWSIRQITATFRIALFAAVRWFSRVSCGASAQPRGEMAR